MLFIGCHPNVARVPGLTYALCVEGQKSRTTQMKKLRKSAMRMRSTYFFSMRN